MLITGIQQGPLKSEKLILEEGLLELFSPTVDVNGQISFSLHPVSRDTAVLDTHQRSKENTPVHH